MATSLKHKKKALKNYQHGRDVEQQADQLIANMESEGKRNVLIGNLFEKVVPDMTSADVEAIDEHFNVNGVSQQAGCFSISASCS